MNEYCSLCIHLNEQKKRCDKHNQKLSYTKYSGAIKFTAFEKCAACDIDDIVAAPMVTLAEDEKAGDVLLKFYRALGWNGFDYLDPCKIRTTKAVYDRLYDTMFDRCPDPVGVGMCMVNRGPGTDDFVLPGNVYLYKGWVSPAEAEGGTDDGLQQPTV